LKALLYKLLRLLGTRTVRLFSWLISTGYFLFLPKRLATSLRFYRALSPEQGLLFRLKCAWRQYHNFAALFAERLLIEQDGTFDYESTGWEHLEEAAGENRGGIIVMSHLGNWETAARMLRRRKLKIMLYLGTKDREQIEGVQKSALEGDDVALVAVGADGGSALEGLEALKWLRKGGLISLTGDRLWKPDQPSAEAMFLNHRVRLPTAPFRLALVAGVPVFFFFGLGMGKGRYHLSVTAPMHLKPASRADREATVARAVQEYASLLETMVRKHPCQWYHFEEFLTPGTPGAPERARR